MRKQKYFDSGESYFAAGKYREAAIQYANAVQIDSGFAQAHYKLGEAYLKLGQGDRALLELNRAVELAPDDFSARLTLVTTLLAARSPDGAILPEYLNQAKPHLDFLRTKQPNNPEVYEAWASYYSDQNNPGAAMQEMQKAIAADPNRSASYLYLASLQFNAGQNDAAEKNFQKAIALDPKAMGPRFTLGFFYFSTKRLSEAEQQFRQAISLDPKDPQPRSALWRVLVAEGHPDQAEAFLKQTKIDLANNPDGYRMLAEFYFSNGDFDRALAEYASLHQTYPKDVAVQKSYVQLLIRARRIDEATKLNAEILKANPHDVDALVSLGQIQLAHGDINAAGATLQNALTNDPHSAVAHFHLGTAFAAQYNESRAESEWREAVRLRPDLVDAQLALSNLELRHGDLDGLTQTAQQIVAALPNSPEGYLRLAIVAMYRQRYADAEQDLHTAMEKAPQSAGPLIQMGNLRLLQKQYADAEGFYRQALDKDPSSAEALSGLMNACRFEKQPDKAIAAVNAQIAKSPNNSFFYDLLGTALYSFKKDVPGSEAALRKAIELDKNNGDAVEKLGKIQVEQGSADQALALYLQSIKDNPHDISLYILAAKLYEGQSNWNQAKAMYQQALAVQPDNPIASNELAYAMLQQGGNVDVALSMAQTARRGMPDSPNAADTLGWAYYQKGIYQSAIDQFQDALRLNEKAGNPDDPDIHYHLGLAYQKANQAAQARQQLERVLKINPNYANAAEVRKALAGLRS